MYASAEERVVELQGESSKVAMAIEAVVSHLRKFLVDQTVLPLFEKSVTTLSLSRSPKDFAFFPFIILILIVTRKFL